MQRMRAAALLLCACGLGCRVERDPLPGFPGVMLWAWERPEDLRFVDPKSVGVAFLAGTVTVRDGAADFKPRLQPLLLPPAIKQMAVLRIESKGRLVSAEFVARMIVPVRQPGVGALQIDYDAVSSERAFYTELTRTLRAQIPREIPLTMTALVSWCASDEWIGDLPVADAVPMYFRMGPEPYLRKAALRSPLCQSSTGLSTDELIRVPLHRRVFLFHPRPWTREALRNAMAEVNRWR
jgi:hypothetical protein